MSSTKRRASLNYQPAFPGPIEGYVVNFLKRNLWRVSSSMEYEDVMQEAFIVFMRVADKYGDEVTEAKHFMSLYKMAWANAFTDMANADSKLRGFQTAGQIQEDDTEDQQAYDPPGDLDCGGFVSILLEQAPREVKEVLRLLAVAPVELLDLLHDSWKKGGHNVANGNSLINKALGRPHGTNSVGIVEQYFAG